MTRTMVPCSALLLADVLFFLGMKRDAGTCSRHLWLRLGLFATGDSDQGGSPGSRRPHKHKDPTKA